MKNRILGSSLLFISLAGLTFVIDLNLPLGVAASSLYILIILLSALYPDLTLPLYLAMLCSFLTLAGAFLSPEGGILWVGVINRFVTILTFWGSAVLIVRRRRSEEQLRRLNLELDAFVRTVSHDLRSPLSPILGFAEYLRSEHSASLPADAQLAIEQIEEQGRRMHAMLEDLLQLAIVGSVERPQEPIDTARLVKEVIVRWTQKAHDVNCELRYTGGLPPVQIPESMLTLILDNLVGNAIRYAGSDGAVEIGGEKVTAGIRLYVRDFGSGLSLGERERVFEPFARGSSVKSAPGTGLGLATVRKLAIHYAGSAWVEETPGGGCTFFVELSDAKPLRHWWRRMIG
ncbi:MAG: HAMP domain-containing histidine kinase [Desulfuromonadales bacterium]|nr:HAMP domain-containing histidine kinase [Desulfuromonadales bacterium]